MLISDITLISSGFSPGLVEKPNKNTTNLLSILLNSKYFNDFVHIFLSKHDIEIKDTKPIIEAIQDEMHNIGENDYYDNYEKFTNKWKEDLQDQGIKEIEEIVSNLGLPINFEFDIYLLLKYRAFRELEHYPLIRYHPTKWHLKVHLEKDVVTRKEYSGITFNHQVSKKELHKWIDENWRYLKSSMELYLPVSPIITTDFKDIEVSSEIYSLYSEGKKPSEILIILSKKYEDNIDIYDTLSLEFIKNKIRRFRNLLKNKEAQLEKYLDEYDELSQ